MKESMSNIAQSFKHKIQYYRRLFKHPGTPWLSRALLWTALAYALSPIDLIPDFIPVLGHLDDLIIIPVLVLLAVWMISEEVMRECEKPESSPALHIELRSRNRNSVFFLDMGGIHE